MNQGGACSSMAMRWGGCAFQVSSEWYGLHASHITAPQIALAFVGLLDPFGGEALDFADGAAIAGDTGIDAGATAGADDGESDVLYRGDSRSPDEIKASGGFKPRIPGSDTSLYDYAANETPSNFVSTSRLENVAEEFALRDGPGYVYNVTPDGLPQIDVNAELGERSPYPEEQEVAIPGGIPYENIVSYRAVP